MQNVRQLIGDIAATVQAQTQSVGEVNTAIVQMDGMTQQNAALVEESSAAAASLADQAGQLVQVASGFRNGEAQAAA